MREKLLNLFEAEARRKLARATLTLELLENHPAGIGDHSTSDFYSNAHDAFREYVDAIGELELIEVRRLNQGW